MYANVTLKSAIAKKSIAVPEEAVIHSGEKETVIVQNSSGGFDLRPDHRAFRRSLRVGSEHVTRGGGWGVLRSGHALDALAASIPLDGGVGSAGLASAVGCRHG